MIHLSTVTLILLHGGLQYSDMYVFSTCPISKFSRFWGKV
jgi:hypothetical protein